ncbi:hypothetical protein PR048_029173 [Dryococelus australis]|uniref:Uncharacterized protein n=1 Tax=Dryococelus australis TaxID=614101 RepID=A0ABQ9GCM2_9NEOP|nr:hypothetical protein PR048_029173 [Dryococelus australis]
MRTGLNPWPVYSRIFVCENSAGRCRWSAGFLGISRFPQPFHSLCSLFTSITLIGSQDLATRNKWHVHQIPLRRYHSTSVLSFRGVSAAVKACQPNPSVAKVGQARAAGKTDQDPSSGSSSLDDDVYLQFELVDGRQHRPRQSEEGRWPPPWRPRSNSLAAPPIPLLSLRRMSSSLPLEIIFASGIVSKLGELGKSNFLPCFAHTPEKIRLHRRTHAADISFYLQVVKVPRDRKQKPVSCCARNTLRRLRFSRQGVLGRDRIRSPTLHCTQARSRTLADRCNRPSSLRNRQLLLKVARDAKLSDLNHTHSKGPHVTFILEVGASCDKFIGVCGGVLYDRPLASSVTNLTFSSRDLLTRKKHKAATCNSTKVLNNRDVKRPCTPASSSRTLTCFRMWESCRTMPLFGGFSRDLSFPPPFRSGAAPYSPHFTLAGSQDLDVNSRPNLFTQSLTDRQKFRETFANQRLVICSSGDSQPMGNLSQHAVANKTRNPFAEPRAANQRMGMILLAISDHISLGRAAWEPVASPFDGQSKFRPPTPGTEHVTRVSVAKRAFNGARSLRGSYTAEIRAKHTASNYNCVTKKDVSYHNQIDWTDYPSYTGVVRVLSRLGMTCRTKGDMYYVYPPEKHPMSYGSLGSRSHGTEAIVAYEDSAVGGQRWQQPLLHDASFRGRDFWLSVWGITTHDA